MNVPLKILWVEDEREWPELFIRTQLKPAAAERGYAFDVAQVIDLETAKAILRNSNNFDIVLLDLGLPDSPTTATVNLVLPEVCPTWPPVIVITGTEEARLDMRCVAKGAEAFLHKLDIAKYPCLAVQEIISSYLRHHRHDTEKA